MNDNSKRKAQSAKRKNWEVFFVKRTAEVLSFALFALSFALPFAGAAAPTGRELFNQGAELYKAGRYSDAIDAFEQAIRRKERSQESQAFIERIRKETVERIRNRALTGVSKANWQTKYYFMNVIDNRVRVGISAQELFERESLNFRPGAVEALNQLAQTLAKAQNARFEVDLINEINLETPPDPTMTALQLTTVYSYLSLASRGNLPKY